MDEYPDMPEAVPTRRILIRSPRKEEAGEYSLLLASQSIKHWMEFDGDEWILSLEEKDARLAQELIDLYRTENRGFQDAPPERRDLDLLLSPLLYLAVPVACYFLVGLSPWANWWHSRGSADARYILDGQWWRCFTAATLHADEAHFLSNLVSGYFILNLLNHRMGIGAIMLLSTLGAGLANYAVALASGPNHVSIGFSSVVFCALGMLAAVETLFLPRRGDKSLRRLTPLISAFFVAVLVGLGENVDVKAHFYGFGIGAVLGLPARVLPVSRGPVLQAGLLLAAYGLYTLAWMLALRT
ncbi:MAG TPA: rhomboid family intramembrane serine protease [Fibrobacteria bacterium]|nr:rhomboid family intramembrane serine protease [Fibrobacteria bacterium]